jgi:hypothetical protein
MSQMNSQQTNRYREEHFKHAWKKAVQERDNWVRHCDALDAENARLRDALRRVAAYATDALAKIGKQS